MHTVKIPESEVEAIIAFYTQPNSLRATCQKFNHGAKYISKLLANYNIPKHTEKVINKFAKMTDDTITNIIETYNSTKSLRATKQQCNISIYKLKQLLKLKNIALPTLAEQAESRAATCLKKYGTSCSLQNSLVKQKAKQTVLLKYGVDHSSKAPIVKEKAKATCLEKYGVSSYAKTNAFKERCKQTNKEKYGTDYYTQTVECKSRVKKTNLKKYGKEYFMQTAAFKVLSQTTCMQKYGVPYSFQSKNNKEKSLATKRLNGTLTTSSIETEFMAFLAKHNIEFKQQYKEVRYPFHCDFYLPKQDLFIELNFNWTHGRKPYDSKSSVDKAIVQEWADKAKNSDYYASAIDVWTKRDPMKQQHALAQSLNYKAIYTIDELNALKLTLI